MLMRFKNMIICAARKWKEKSNLCFLTHGSVLRKRLQVEQYR